MAISSVAVHFTLILVWGCGKTMRTACRAAITIHLQQRCDLFNNIKNYYQLKH